MEKLSLDPIDQERIFNMLNVAFILLFLLASVSIYALIVSKKNYLILFLLTPIVLSSSVFTAYSIFALQGTPINGVPKHDVSVLWVEMSKPDIFFVVRTEDPDDEDRDPKYYRIDYTEENKKTMKKLQEEAKGRQGQGVPGKFEKGNAGTKDSWLFVPMESFEQPAKPIIKTDRERRPNGF